MLLVTGVSSNSGFFSVERAKKYMHVYNPIMIISLYIYMFREREMDRARSVSRPIGRSRSR